MFLKCPQMQISQHTFMDNAPISFSLITLFSDSWHTQHNLQRLDIFRIRDLVWQKYLFTLQSVFFYEDWTGNILFLQECVVNDESVVITQSDMQNIGHQTNAKFVFDINWQLQLFTLQCNIIITTFQSLKTATMHVQHDVCRIDSIFKHNKMLSSNIMNIKSYEHIKSSKYMNK